MNLLLSLANKEIRCNLFAPLLINMDSEVLFVSGRQTIVVGGCEIGSLNTNMTASQKCSQNMLSDVFCWEMSDRTNTQSILMEGDRNWNISTTTNETEFHIFLYSTSNNENWRKNESKRRIEGAGKEGDMVARYWAGLLVPSKVTLAWGAHLAVGLAINEEWEGFGRKDGRKMRTSKKQRKKGNNDGWRTEKIWKRKRSTITKSLGVVALLSKQLLEVRFAEIAATHGCIVACEWIRVLNRRRRIEGRLEKKRPMR